MVMDAKLKSELLHNAKATRMLHGTRIGETESTAITVIVVTVYL